MKRIKQTIGNAIMSTPLVFGAIFAAVTLMTTPLHAADPVSKCGGVVTSIINCDQDNTDKDGDGTVSNKETGLWGLLILAVNILIAGVGVLALAGTVYGAILYITAAGSPEQVKKAYGIFTNVVVGIVAFAGMWAFLNFLIPGGAFNDL